MASTQRHFEVEKDIQSVWQFVCHMSNWAVHMPGYISHRELDRDNSIWTLQVDVGPFQREVDIAVRVLRWDAPHSVQFEIEGKTETFTGSGRYHATPTDGTAILLEFSVEPGGPMATMVNALAVPVLEKVADQFSTSLHRGIDGRGGGPKDTLRVSPIRLILKWLRRLWK